MVSGRLSSLKRWITMQKESQVIIELWVYSIGWIPTSSSEGKEVVLLGTNFNGIRGNDHTLVCWEFIL